MIMLARVKLSSICRWVSLWLVALCLMLPGFARANQVANPFFTGTSTAATSWTSSAAGTGAAFAHALSAANATITAAGGSTEFYSGCVGAACLTYPFTSGTTSGAQQTVPTTVGQGYTISFWTYYAVDGTTTEIDVYWGSTKIFAGSSQPTGWSQHTISLGTATATSNVLTVMVRDDPNYSAITDMDIEPVGPNLSFAKTSATVCDPVNGKTNPKSIPGAAVQYALTIANTGAGSATLTTLTDSLPSNLTFDTKLNSGAAPASNCVAGNTVNSLSATGFAMHSGTGTGPGVTPPGVASDAGTAGASVSGQTVTVNFATLATSSVTAPAAATLAAGSYITVYFNAFVN